MVFGLTGAFRVVRQAGMEDIEVLGVRQYRKCVKLEDDKTEGLRSVNHGRDHNCEERKR